MSRVDYRQAAREAAARHGLDPDLFVRQIGAESNFNPTARSPAGALGIAQIMPGTAKGWGVDPLNPMQALDVSAKNMAKYVRDYGGWRNALIAYNAGPGRVGKPLYNETANYIKKLLGDKHNVKGGAQPVPKVPGAAPSGGAGQQRQSYGLSAVGPSAASSLLEEGSFLRSYMERQTYAAPTPPARAQRPSPEPSGAGGGGSSGKGVPKRRSGEKGYQYLQRIGQTMFGLRNDAGNGQTTGGKHTDGSRHYAGQAVDFGDAKNTREQLQRYHDYLDANRDELGLAELIWQAPGHYNHVHAATLRSLRPGAKHKGGAA